MAGISCSCDTGKFAVAGTVRLRRLKPPLLLRVLVRFLVPKDCAAPIATIDRQLVIGGPGAGGVTLQYLQVSCRCPAPYSFFSISISTFRKNPPTTFQSTRGKSFTQAEAITDLAHPDTVKTLDVICVSSVSETRPDTHVHPVYLTVTRPPTYKLCIQCI